MSNVDNRASTRDDDEDHDGAGDEDGDDDANYDEDTGVDYRDGDDEGAMMGFVFAFFNLKERRYATSHILTNG